MIKKTISSILVALHIFTFGYIKDGLAAICASANYSLNAASANEGGQKRSAVSGYTVSQDVIGEACASSSASSAAYSVKAGYINSIQPNPPVLMQVIPNQSWLQNKSLTGAFNLDNYFSSAEGLVLTYGVSGNKNISVAIDQTHAVSFSQPSGWTGTETATFIALDSDGNITVSNPVTLQVQGATNPPLLDFIADITCNETGLVAITPHATDPNGYSITYSFTVPLDPTGKWQTNYSSSGTYTTTVTATDEIGLKASQNVKITVLNVNRPPALISINGIAVTSGSTVILPDIKEGDILQITPVAADPDNDTVTFGYSSGSGAKIDSTGKWLTTYGDAGTYTITVSATDGIATIIQNAQVKILKVNRPPVSTLNLSTYAPIPNETFNITLTAQDLNGYPMTYAINKDGVQISSGAIANTVTIQASFATIGDHTVIATVTDTSGLVSSNTSTVAVPDPNANRDSITPIMGDFNGDGLTDLGSHNSDTGSWEICLSQSGLFKDSSTWLTGFGTSKDWIPVSGDFNGDGRTDIGIYNNTTGELKIALSDGTKFNSPATWLTFSGASYSWIPFTGSFNGSKCTSFGLYNQDTGEWRVAQSNGSGFSAPVTWLTGFGGSNYTPLTGDFNSDGLTDICIFNKSAGEFKIAFSNGKTFIPQTKAWITNYCVNHDPIIADFNNDGLPDAGYFDNTNGKWYYASNTGSSFVDSGTWISNFGSSTNDTGYVGDFDANGLTDAAIFDKTQNGVNKWTVQLSTNKPQDLLVEIDNGIGGVTQVTYQYAAKFNNDLLPFPIYVASQISSINTYPQDRAATYTQAFTYEGGWYDSADREFRGFNKITVTDPITGNYTQTYFYQGNPAKGEDGALKGQIQKIVAYDGNGHMISEADNTWDVRKAGPTDGQLGFPYLQQVTQTVYEENAASITTQNQFTYDNVGNIIRENCLGDVSVTGDEKSTSTSYFLPYEQGHNRPAEVDLLDCDNNLVNKKTFIYDSNGNLTKETAYLDGANDPQTQYAYDDYGNVTQTTNAQGHTVLTSYESALHAYPETITNELGHTITYTYNTALGVVTGLTDVNGNTTQTVYDTLGRITQQKNTQGQVVTSYSYPDFNTKVTTQMSLNKTEYIDGLGRLYQSVSDGEDGTNKRQVSTEVYFNNRGLKDSESLPHYIDIDPSQISYTRYTYDLRGRTKTITADFPGVLKDAISSINYINPLYMETTDPRGVRKGTQKDVYGNTIKITEFTQPGTYNTMYEYDLKGNLTKVTDNQGNITQIQYDTLGRKTLLNDPDTGITTYSYDKLGNLLTQTDNKGQTIMMEYDVLSRLTKKSNGAAVLATYEYDNTSKPNCLGRLSKVASFTGDGGLVTGDYFYDTEGRAVKVEKTIDGTIYTTQTAYDLVGRATSITYPDGKSVYYLYSQNSGLLKAVSDTQGVSDTAYVKNIAYNAAGQILNINYGNNTRTIYTYGLDMRLSRIFTQNQSTQTLQDLNYDFDLNGNITTLTDNLRSNIRQYTYDDLNRLTKADNTPDPNGGYATFNYQYDSIGNMTYKSDTGFMSYGNPSASPSLRGAEAISHQGEVPSMPHAVFTAGSNAYTYDNNGNMLSSPNKLMTYDAQNRMIKLETATETTAFTYDADGSRIKKSTGSNSTTYISSLFEKDQDGTIRKHIFAGANRIATVSGTQGVSDTVYYHSDHLGSTSIITDSTGAQVQRCEYTPYGTIAQNEGADVTPYKFTGKELDSTGLYFYAWRYYDPTIGRFCQPDTIIPQPYNPQTLNRYSYCDNNPLNYTDPTGHFSWKKFWHSAVGALVGAVLTICLGPAGMGLSYAMAGFIGGMAGGAITGGLNGGARGALIGGITGGILGGIGGWAYGLNSPVGDMILGGMMAGGVGYAAATNSWDSLAGGFVGGLCGAAVGGSIIKSYSQQFANYRGGNGFVSNSELQLKGNLQQLVDAHISSTTNQASAVRQQSFIEKSVSFKLMKLADQLSSSSLTFNAGNGIVGVSGQLTLGMDGIKGRIGFGWGVSTGVSWTSNATIGESSGWGITASVSGGGGIGGEISGTLSQGGKSVDFGAGLGVGAGGSVTVGYEGDIISW